MYFYNPKIRGWEIHSKNKLDYYISFAGLIFFEFIPLFLEGLLFHGAKEFIITKEKKEIKK